MQSVSGSSLGETLLIISAVKDPGRRPLRFFGHLCYPEQRSHFHHKPSKGHCSESSSGIRSTDSSVCVCVCVCVSHSVVSDSATPWTVPTRLLCPWEFFRQEYWSELPFPSAGIFPTQGSNPDLLHCRFFTIWATREGGHMASTGWYLPFPLGTRGSNA